METRSASAVPEDPRATAIRRITQASEAATSTGRSRTDSKAVAATREIALAVGAARDLDVSWQTIGDALGMRRGAAYQRFRQGPPPRILEMHESPIDGVTVLALRGEVDALTVPRLTEAIGHALADVPMGLIVDVDGLTFMSSAGMTALLTGDRSARRQGKRFAVVADSPVIRRPMTVVGLLESLVVYRTVHAAMVGLHALADSDPPAE